MEPHLTLTSFQVVVEQQDLPSQHYQQEDSLGTFAWTDKLLLCRTTRTLALRKQRKPNLCLKVQSKAKDAR